ncbi:hypothetical protein, partial [Pseudomonas fluorescens]
WSSTMIALSIKTPVRHVDVQHRQHQAQRLNSNPDDPRVENTRAPLEC